MIRSYALTAAAITLRMYLPLVFLFQWPFSIAYPAIAWLCWIRHQDAAERPQGYADSALRYRGWECERVETQPASPDQKTRE